MDARDDIHAMLLDDGFDYVDGTYRKSGTTWRLEFHSGGYRLVAIAGLGSISKRSAS